MPSPLRRYFTTPHPAVVATRLFLAAVFLLSLHALLCGTLLWRDRRELVRGLFPA